MKIGRRELTTLCALAFIPVFGATMLSPLYPLMMTQLNLSSLQLGTVVACGSAATLFTSPLAGILGAKRGVQSIMRPLLTLYIAGALLSGLTRFLAWPAFLTLLLGRAFQGCGEIGGLQQGISLVAANASPDERGKHMSRLESLASAGAAIGPLVGGFLSRFGWWTAYFTSASLMAAVVLTFPLSLKRGTSGGSRGSSAALKPTKKLFAAGLSCSALMFGLTGTQTFVVGFLTSRFGISATTGGIAVSLHALAMALGAFTSARWIDEHRAPKFIRVGLLGFSLMLVSMPYHPSVIFAMAVMTVGGIACGLILPSSNLVGTASVPEALSSRAASIVYVLRISGSIAGSLTFGWLLQWGYRVMFCAGATLTFVAALVLPIVMAKDQAVPEVSLAR